MEDTRWGRRPPGRRTDQRTGEEAESGGWPELTVRSAGNSGDYEDSYADEPERSRGGGRRDSGRALRGAQSGGTGGAGAAKGRKTPKKTAGKRGNGSGSFDSREAKRLRRIRRRLIFRCALLVLIFAVGLGTGWFLRGTTIRRLVDLSAIEAPSWIDQQFLTVNPYSRPGTKLAVINGIVVHYVGNPGTSAQQNHDYFEGLKNQSGSNTTSVSSHFIIGLDGEVIQCIPLDEKSFASNNRNGDTISIECCHPEEDGAFTEETYESLVRLTAWLCEELDLGSKEVIRHYDVTGKVCPKYFVDHEDAWKQFGKDVKKAMR